MDFLCRRGATVTTTTRKFTIDADTAIHHLIVSQAGSISKALLETIMNSIDAGATKVELKLDLHGYVVKDNGRGFDSEDEIVQCFGHFAFDHTTPEQRGRRQFGRFGVGRGQQFAWASTVYRSRRFTLDIDTQKRGLNYDLTIHQTDHPGTCITGTFRTPLTLNALEQTEREIVQMIRYSNVLIKLNGKAISKNPADESWDLETPEAYYRFRDSYSMAIYNIGMFVRDFPAHHVGVGGVVVTKPNHPLTLNIARNDVLVSECPVWKEITAVCRKQARANTKRSRLSETDYQNIIGDLKNNQADRAVLDELKLFVDLKGRSYTAYEFIQAARNRQSTVLLHNEKRQRLLENIHANKDAFVLHPRTLSRLDKATGSESGIEQIQQTCLLILKALNAARGYLDIFNHLHFLPEIPKALSENADTYTVLPTAPEHLLAAVKAVNTVLPDINSTTNRFILERGLKTAPINHTVKVGVSDAANFWIHLNSLVIEQRVLENGLRSTEAWNRLLLEIARAVLNLKLDPTRETAEENHELERHLMYSADFTGVWGGMPVTSVVGGIAPTARKGGKAEACGLSLAYLTLM